MLHLDAQHGGLHAVEAAVPSHLVVKVTLAAAVVAQAAHAFGDLRILRGHAAGLTRGAEVFCGIKAECGGLSQRARAFAPP